MNFGHGLPIFDPRKKSASTNHMIQVGSRIGEGFPDNFQTDARLSSRIPDMGCLTVFDRSSSGHGDE